MKIAPLDLPIETLRAELDRVRHPLRVAVMRAKNPFNVGAIIRVAHSFMVKEIILVGDAPYYERAAMGMDRYENIREMPDEASLIAYAREHSLPLVVLEKDDASESLWRAELPAEVILVFGSEDSGVGPVLSAAADRRVAIPMYGVNHSFPLAIAAGIAMAEWCRRHVEGGRTI